METNINIKKVCSLSSKLIISLVLICSNLAHSEDENKIIIANGEWYPLISKNLQHFGVLCHIISEAFAKEGVKVVYKWVPWKRAYQHTLNGTYDATAAWVPTPERKKLFIFSDTMYTNQKVFFHLKSYNFDWKTIADLQGISIGGAIGYTYGIEFDKAAKAGTINIQWTKTDKQNFNKLLAKRIKIFPQEVEIGYGYISEFPTEQAKLLTHHPKPLMQTTHHLIFSKKIKKNTKLVQLFNSGLKKLKDSGKYNDFITASRSGKYIKDK
ncbi:substrate-binding periplasmic protein [Spartinivicinus poritis]|uniref:Transporter substrate-binding domain-containing protein n=1 Tax=Spartinivicinus poritis TaxID=2994640 RepID=A0ABT5UDI4_9GAMM|nr:transporter substrate-binding domain-containing protein [Spartinivicinus sp. A2-2]MDE1464280.1 transporter substrate-binding domain-containing protein [Spartinivicinus sp. A2-2]